MLIFIDENFLGPMKTANRILDGAAKDSHFSLGLVEMYEFLHNLMLFPDHKMRKRANYV